MIELTPDQVFGVPETAQPDEGKPTLPNTCRQCGTLIYEEFRYFCTEQCQEEHWRGVPPLPEKVKLIPSKDDLQRKLSGIHDRWANRLTPVTLKNGTNVRIIADKEDYCPFCDKDVLVAMTVNDAVQWIDDLGDGFDVHVASCKGGRVN